MQITTRHCSDRGGSCSSRGAAELAPAHSKGGALFTQPSLAALPTPRASRPSAAQLPFLRPQDLCRRQLQVLWKERARFDEHSGGVSNPGLLEDVGVKLQGTMNNTAGWSAAVDEKMLLFLILFIKRKREDKASAEGRVGQNRRSLPNEYKVSKVKYTLSSLENQGVEQENTLTNGASIPETFHLRSRAFWWAQEGQSPVALWHLAVFWSWTRTFYPLFPRPD